MMKKAMATTAATMGRYGYRASMWRLRTATMAGSPGWAKPRLE
jgi:hypothetical protein